MVSFTTVSTLVFAVLASAVAIDKRVDGEASWFNPGLGACGGTNSDGDFIVAVSPDTLNNKSNCGRTITASGAAGTATVTIVDLCPSCPDNKLDLSPAAFQAIVGDLSQGIGSITWNLN